MRLHLLRIPPVVGEACVALVLAADERALLDAGHVRGGGARHVRVGPQLLVEADQHAGVLHVGQQLQVLRIAAVAQVHASGAAEANAVEHPLAQLLVRSPLLQIARRRRPRLPTARRRRGQEWKKGREGGRPQVAAGGERVTGRSHLSRATETLGERLDEGLLLCLWKARALLYPPPGGAAAEHLKRWRDRRAADREGQGELCWARSDALTVTLFPREHRSSSDEAKSGVSCVTGTGWSSGDDARRQSWL